MKLRWAAALLATGAGAFGLVYRYRTRDERGKLRIRKNLATPAG